MMARHLALGVVLFAATTLHAGVDLTVVSSHAGSFTQGVTGRTYRILVRNVGSTSSAGTMTVTDILPDSLTATAMTGAGWSCSLGSRSCTRSNVLPPGGSSPVITLTVSVSDDAPMTVTNIVTVAGGGDTNPGNNTTVDATTVWGNGECLGLDPGVSLPTSDTAGKAAVADFDGNGTLDLAVASGANTVSVFLGNGNATFAPRTDYSIGTNRRIATGDFNGDANVDILTTGSFLQHANGETYLVWDLSLLPGNGDGTFQAATIRENRGGSDMVVGDFNGDGYSDAVLVPWVGTGVVVELGSAGGLLESAAPAAESVAVTAVSYNYTAGIAAADFNIDGKTDVAIANGDLRLHRGNGDGTFQAGEVLSTERFRALGTGDFNGDGHPDLAAMGLHHRVFLNDGRASFSSLPLSGADTLGSQLLVADFDGDGHEDLIFPTNLARGMGDGRFAPKAQLSVVDYVTAVADFNGDDRADLAITPAYPPKSVSIRPRGCFDLAITKWHNGNFFPGQTRAYTLTVTNTGATPIGAVTITDDLPDGLTAKAIDEESRYCKLDTLTCTYPGFHFIAGRQKSPWILVDVASSIPSPSIVTNVARVSSEGELNTANNAASDPTTIETPVDLAVHATAMGVFGRTGTYTIIVENVGRRTTYEEVRVGASRWSTASGSGWNCNEFQCARSDALPPSAAYPPITLNVAVETTSPPVTFTRISVLGGGAEVVRDNNDIEVETHVLTAPQQLTATASSPAQILVTWAAVPYATQYIVLRGTRKHGPFEPIGSTAGLSYLDGSVLPGGVYLYKAVAAAGTAEGPPSALDFARAFLYTDDPLVPRVTTIRAVHFVEVCQTINGLLIAAGVAGGLSCIYSSPIRAAHLNELVVAVRDPLFVLGAGDIRLPGVYAGKRVYAVELQRLRSVLR